MKATLVALFLTAPLSAQPSVTSPQLGFLSDSNHTLRPLLGIAGNFLLGDPAGEDVIDVASSASFAMVKASSSLQVLDRNGVVLFSKDVGSGPAVFAFDSNAQPALAWLPASRSLLAWKGDRFDELAWSLDDLAGEVVAIALDRLVVKRTGGLWLLRIAPDGSQMGQAALPGLAGPVSLAADGSLLYADETALVVRGPDGTEHRIETGIVITAIAPLSLNWVRIVERNSPREYAVCLSPGRAQSYQLPGGGTCCGR